MQASEIKMQDLNYISSNLQKYIDIFYFADSFGSLKIAEAKKLSENIKKKFSIPFGIHAHDNLGMALKNSVSSIKSGASWVDGTVLGMGRGPGNTKTEELMKSTFLNKCIKIRKKNFSQIVSQFRLLKKKFKWGTNNFYKFSGKNKIHPTYTQMLISDKRINNKNIMSILKNITKSKSKKFDPNELYSATIFYKKNINNLRKIESDFLNKYNNFIIINSQIRNIKLNLKAKRFLEDKKSLKIMINETKNKKLENLCEMNSTCHPIRLMAIKRSYDRPYKKILIPFSNLRLNKNIKINKKKIIDYPIAINNRIIIKKNYAILPEPLSLIYTLCFLISSSIKDIKLLGFEGYKETDPFQDKTQEIFLMLLKKIKNLKLTSLTKTNFKLSP